MTRVRYGGSRVACLLGVMSLAVAACGSSSSSSSSNGGQAEATQEPGASDPANQGGTIVIGTPQEPTSFLASGITDSMTFSVAVNAPIVEGLIWPRSVAETASAKTQADFFRPMLATEVPTVANGDVKTSSCTNTAAKMCVTWKLRDGVTWHDGSTFSSHDVCDTYQFFYLKYKDKNPTAILSTTGWDQVIKCTEDNPLQATIDFKSIYGAYLGLGAGVYAVIPSKQLDVAFAANGGKGDDITKVQQTLDLTKGSHNSNAYSGSETLDKAINGTGPYVFQKYEPTKDIILVKNQNYWDKAHQPHLDRIVFKFVASTTAQLAEARAGTIDFGLDYRLKFLQDLLNLEKSPGKIHVQTVPESGSEKIDMNVCANAHGLCGSGAKKSPYLADKTIRHAILAGINRQQIVDTIAAGQTSVPDDSWIYLGLEFIRTPDVPHTKYDPAAANAALDAAGYQLSPSCDGGKTRKFKDGTCIDLDIATTSGNKAREDAEPLIAQDLQAIGIHINTPFKNVTSGKLFNSFGNGGVLYTHQFDLGMYTNTVGTPGEPDTWFSGYHADCGGTCPQDNQITSATSPNGQNDTGEDNPQVDTAFDNGRHSIDLPTRTKAYQQAEVLLAQDLPEIPLYQQVLVNSYTVKLHGLKNNPDVWTFNIADWYCTGGNCQA